MCQAYEGERNYLINQERLLREKEEENRKRRIFNESLEKVKVKDQKIQEQSLEELESQLAEYKQQEITIATKLGVEPHNYTDLDLSDLVVDNSHKEIHQTELILLERIENMLNIAKLNRHIRYKKLGGIPEDSYRTYNGAG